MTESMHIFLKYDIEVLIMDLKSGNFEEGMTEFDKRLGNSYVSRLSKALIAVNRGDDQSSMLNYLLSDMGYMKIYKFFRLRKR